MGIDVTKTVSRVFDKASLKLISAATETSKKIEIWLVAEEVLAIRRIFSLVES